MSDNPTFQAYDRYADVYDQEVVDFWEQFPTEFIQAFQEQAPGNRVLNLGSGSGRDAVLLRQLGFEVTCVDASAAMVDMTRMLGFTSVQADFRTLDFTPESFDGIWAYTSLIHIPKSEAEEVLRSVRGLIPAGGVLALGVIQGDHDGMVTRDSMPDEARYFKFYTADELRGMAESAGYEFVYAKDYQPRNSVYLNHLYVKP
ncbi:MAG: methyltransferase domain-containing protein [Candidatus Saccharibacteria bacterium]|nr:methyltransferase domain-containing protein [Candidatus Saccharibacteria bacterium]